MTEAVSCHNESNVHLIIEQISNILEYFWRGLMYPGITSCRMSSTFLVDLHLSNLYVSDIMFHGRGLNFFQIDHRQTSLNIFQITALFKFKWTFPVSNTPQYELNCTLFKLMQ